MTLHGRRLARVISYEMKCIPRFLALILAASPAFAGEYVVFSSGLKMRADRHEQSGGVIRLFYNGGVTEIPAMLVSGFEAEEVVTPEPAPPEPVVVEPLAPPIPAARDSEGPQNRWCATPRNAPGFLRNSSRAWPRWNRDSGLTPFRLKAPWESCS